MIEVRGGESPPGAAPGAVAARLAVALFFLAWIGSCALLWLERRPLEDALALLVIFGLVLPGVALLVCRRLEWLPVDPPRVGEGALLAALAASVTLYLATKTKVLAMVTPADAGPRLVEAIDAGAKLVAFVGLPLLAYAVILGCRPSALGLGWPPGPKATMRRSWLALVVLGAVLAGTQLLIGRAARPLVDGSLSGRHWILGVLLAWLWFSLEAGLVEETFFRVVLQTRLAALTRSPVAGLFLSALVFGLAHAPGLWLRGAGIDDGIGQSPSLALAVATSVTTMAVAGLVFGVLWLRTRNWLLLVVLHGLVDALSNAARFMDRWGL